MLQERMQDSKAEQIRRWQVYLDGLSNHCLHVKSTQVKTPEHYAFSFIGLS